jgi:sugar O-acyltransferase (sialic acid O-acetyltransferase NeuD family)
MVIDTLRATGHHVTALYDDSPHLWGTEIDGVRVAGAISSLTPAECPAAVVGIGANHVRRALAERLPGVEWVTAAHPAAHVHPSVQLGPGTVVFAGAILQLNVRIGAHVIINTAATADHDCVIGDYAHLAPGVRLAGSIHVESDAFLGIGSVVIPGRRIGRRSIVGAGGVVIADVPDDTTVVGVPARPLPQRSSGAAR